MMVQASKQLSVIDSKGQGVKSRIFYLYVCGPSHYGVPGVPVWHHTFVPT